MEPTALLISLINPSGLDEKDISRHGDSVTAKHPFSKVLRSILYRSCGLAFFADCGMPDGYENITATQHFPMRAPERAQDLPVNSGRLICLVALADSGCICLNGLNARVGIL